MAAVSRRSRILLLLPSPPSPISYSAIKAAYHAPILTVLRELTNSSQPSQGQALLELALPVPELSGNICSPRALYYTHVQRLVANLYKLMCITASREGIDTETTNGIDARVLLIAFPEKSDLALRNESHVEDNIQGPVISLEALARSKRHWDHVYSVPDEGESNLNILSIFQSVSETPRNYKNTQRSITPVGKSIGGNLINEAAGTVHHLSVAVGGTFDHLHIGHKLLLTMFAFVLSQDRSESRSRMLTVGITGDALLVNKKYAEHLESWKRRQESTHDFLSSLIWFGPENDTRIRIEEVNESGPNGHAVHISYPSGLAIRYVEISDPFGPTVTDRDITALVLSLETRSGGEAVNTKRNEQGWPPLEVFEVDVLDASEEDNNNNNNSSSSSNDVDETFQSKLSSTEIRRKCNERFQTRSKA